jgi:hypothetical protein
LYCILWFTVDCLSGLWVFVLHFMIYCWLSFWIVKFLYCISWFTLDFLSGLGVYVQYFMIYCWMFLRVVKFCTVFYDLMLIFFLYCEFFVLYFMIYGWLSFWTKSVLQCILWFTVDCLSGFLVFCSVFYVLMLIVFLNCEVFVLYFMIYCWLSFWIVSFLYCILWFTVDCLSG